MMKFLYRLLLFASLFLYPCEIFTVEDGVIKSKYRNAEKYESAFDYQAAIPLLKELVNIAPGNSNFNFKLGLAISESNSDEDPLTYLEVAAQNVSSKYFSSYDQVTAPPLVLKYLVREYMHHNKYKEAKATLEKYKTYVGPKDRENLKFVTVYSEYIETGIDLGKKPVRIRTLDFGSNFVKNCTAHSPVFSPDESIYIFASPVKTKERSPNSYEDMPEYNDDISYIYFDGKRWSNPLPVTNLNTSSDEAPLSITPDGTQLIIYRYDNGDGNLYYSDLQDNMVWSKPKKFPSPINSLAQETSATMSADGTKIYFTSDREGGKGGLDIYVCSKERNGKWGRAINLVRINSPFNEESPHLQANSNVLYFSSDKTSSMGGLDIFKCNLFQDTVAQDIMNMGYPLNSSNHEMFFKTSMDGKRAFYSSPCKTKKGALDLKVVELLDAKLLPGVIVKGLVLNSKRDTIKSYNTMLFDIGNREIVDSSVPKNNYFTFRVNQERKYFASFEYNDYVYFSKPFNIQKYFSNLSFTNQIYLDPIVISDSSFRQSKEGFKVYKNKLMAGSVSDELVEMTRNMPSNELSNTPPDELDLIAYIERQKTEKVSRLSNTVTSARDIYKPRAVALDIAMETKQYDNTPVVDTPLVFKVDSSAIIDGVLVIDYKKMADSLQRLGIVHYNDAQYVPCIEKMEQALVIYEKIDDKREQIVCLNYIAKAHFSMGRTDEALGINQQALELIRKVKSRVLEGEKLENIGDIFASVGDVSNAIENYNNSLIIRRELKDKPGEIRLLNSIANLLYNQKDFDNSIKYLNEMLGYNVGNDKALAELYNKIGLSYHGKRDYDSAIVNFDKAISLSGKIGDKRSKSVYLNNEGNSFYELMSLEKALEAYKHSLAIKDEIGYEEGKAITFHNIGNVHRKKNNNNDAISNYTNSNTIASKYGYYELQGKNHFGLMQVYKNLGNYNMALNHFKMYADLRIPFLNKHGQQQISQSSDKYEVSDRDIALMKRNMLTQDLMNLKEAEKRRSEIELLKSQQERQKVFQAITIVGVLAMFILFALAVYRYLTKRKNYRLLAMKNAEISQKNEEIVTLRENLADLNVQLAQLSIVASETSNGVAIFDNKCNFEWVNKGYTAMYGFDIKELNSKENDNIYNDLEDKKIQKDIERAVANHRSISFDVCKKTKKGSKIWVSVSMTPIFNDGNLYKIISIESDINEVKLAEVEINIQKQEIEQHRDEIAKQRDLALEQKDQILLQKEKLESTITELQATQKKLVESEKMASLGNLVAGISHEINTPIGIGIAAITTLNTKVQSITTLFEDKKMKQTDLLTYLATAKESARLIQTNLNRTGELVKSFKRISVDEITEQMRTFNLNQYINDIVRSLEPKINEKVVGVKIICPDNIEMNSYPGAYAQIYTNLISNTILHGYKNKEGGTITITCEAKGNTIRMVYADDGNGMAPEVVEKVFNPFFTTNMQTGNGLGMNIVYNIVTQKLQGDIVCKSELGKGVSFIIDCPVIIKQQTKEHTDVVS